MFAAPGYVPLSWLMSRGVPADTYNAWYDLYTKRLEEAGVIYNLKDVWSISTPAAAYENSFLNSVTDHTYLCSPSGATLAFDMATVRREEFGYFLHHSSHHALTKELGAELKVPDEILDKYRTFADYELMKREAAEEGLSMREAAEIPRYAYTHRHLSLFYERITYTIDLGAFDYWASLLGPSRAVSAYLPLVERLRQFAGWSICVTTEYAEGDWLSNLTEHVESSNAPWEGADAGLIAPSTGGRPRDRRDATGRAYELLYPDGHGTETWGAVLRKVCKYTGVDVSEITLKRAVQELKTTPSLMQK
jgi:hypothetical protein